MNQIRKYFETLVDLNDDQWNIFSSRLEKASFPRGETLLSAGEIENYLSFIEEGIVRFYIPKSHNDITFDFGFENKFISAYDSFITRSPSIYQVEALRDTILWRISYDDLQQVYSESTVGNTIGRFAAEGLYLRKSKREKSFLTKTAEERYMNLLEEHSKIMQHIPLKYIASYIGITPQALSRIRSRIS